MSALGLEVGVLGFLLLGCVGGAHELTHLVLVRLNRELVLRVCRLVHVPAILVGDLELTDALLFLRILRLENIILLLILADCKQ